MNWITAIGLAAGFLTTIAFVPQMIKVVRTRHTKDLSLLMYIIVSTGIFLWLVYGLLSHDVPVVAANIPTLLFALTILAFKIRYK